MSGYVAVFESPTVFERLTRNNSVPMSVAGINTVRVDSEQSISEEEQISYCELQRKVLSIQGELTELKREVHEISTRPGLVLQNGAQTLVAELDVKLDGMSSYVNKYIFSIQVPSKRPAAIRHWQGIMTKFDEELRCSKSTLRRLANREDVRSDPRHVRGDQEIQIRPQFRSFLEKTKLPVFSGKVEEFPDFKH